MRDPHLTPLVLVAHGSRDPRAAAATSALACRVAAARRGLPVAAAYLDHALPRPDAVLDRYAADGHRAAVAVPLLLTSAYHGRVDVPAALSDARLPTYPAAVLGPDPALVPALARQVPGCDAVVLAAAGTRDAAARATVSAMARRLGEALGVPAAPAYASAASPDPATAVRELRARGARRVGVAAYFLAPGLLYDRARTGALAEGAALVGAPLGAAPELVKVILDRYDRARGALADTA